MLGTKTLVDVVEELCDEGTVSPLAPLKDDCEFANERGRKKGGGRACGERRWEKEEGLVGGSEEAMWSMKKDGLSSTGLGVVSSSTSVLQTRCDGRGDEEDGR